MRAARHPCRDRSAPAPLVASLANMQLSRSAAPALSTRHQESIVRWCGQMALPCDRVLLLLYWLFGVGWLLRRIDGLVLRVHRREQSHIIRSTATCGPMHKSSPFALCTRTARNDPLTHGSLDRIVSAPHFSSSLQLKTATTSLRFPLHALFVIKNPPPPPLPIRCRPRQLHCRQSNLLDFPGCRPHQIVHHRRHYLRRKLHHR